MFQHRQDLGCVERGFALDTDLNAFKEHRSSRHVGERAGPLSAGRTVASADAEGPEAVEAELGHKPTNSFVGS